MFTPTSNAKFNAAYKERWNVITKLASYCDYVNLDITFYVASAVHVVIWTGKVSADFWNIKYVDFALGAR